MPRIHIRARWRASSILLLAGCTALHAQTGTTKAGNTARAANADEERVIQEVVDELLKDITTIQNEYFSVSSFDSSSAGYVASLGNGIYDYCSDYLAMPEDHPSLIDVRLVPALSWDQPRASYTSLDVAGKVLLSIRWARDTKKEDLIFALVQACMTRSFVWNFGTSKVRSMPPWLQVGLTEVVRIKHNRAWETRNVEAARLAEPMPLKDIFRARRFDTHYDSAVLNSYILLDAFDRAYRGRAQALITQLMFAEDPYKLLAKLDDTAFKDEASAQAWWEERYEAFCRRPTGSFKTLITARDAVSGFTILVVDTDKEIEVLTITEAWRRGNEPAVREALRKHINAIRDELAVTNPLYFNALLSIGQVWEAVLKGEYEVMLNAYENFKNDMWRAMRWNAAISTALGEEEEETLPGLQ